jgi:parvulin-like peptidyl-prolyl isomerase
MTLIVNGEKIEDWQVQQEVGRLRPHYERVFADNDSKEREAQLLDWSKENVIERVLLNQQAKEHGEPIPAAEVESAFAWVKKQHYSRDQSQKELTPADEEKIKKAVELQMRVERLLRNVCEDTPQPAEEDILKFYEQNKERLKSPEQVRVAHIVKHINAQTDESTARSTMVQAQNDLKKGALFETLVEKYSDCPDNGGDLGYITKGQMVEEFEDVVFNLGVNEVSGIFQTRFGFHIAKLYDRKPATLHTLEEVRETVADELKEKMRRKAIDRFVDHLKSKAKIEET